MFEKQLQGWQILIPHMPTPSISHQNTLKGREVNHGIWLEPPLKSHGTCALKTNHYLVVLSRGRRLFSLKIIRSLYKWVFNVTGNYMPPESGE